MLGGTYVDVLRCLSFSLAGSGRRAKGVPTRRRARAGDESGVAATSLGIAGMAWL